MLALPHLQAALMSDPSQGGDETVIMPRRASPVAGVPQASPPQPARRGLLFAGVAVVALLLAAGGGWWLLGSGPQSAPPAPPPEQVAVVSPPAGPVPAAQPADARVDAAPPAPLAAAPPAVVPPAVVPPLAAPPAEAPQQVALLAPVPKPPETTPPITAPAPLPPFDIKPADEAAILAHSAAELAVFHFVPAPSVVVLDFPSLLDQGMALNRVAAFVEKAGQPHDRVLDDAGLDAAVKAHGDTTGSYYYGHDYTAAQLARFFTLADKDAIKLNPAEQRVRALLDQLGWLKPGGPPPAALLSISRAGADPDITPAARAAILHHELSHGAYFTEPKYAAYVRNFWQTGLTAKEREAIRHYLAADGYEPGDEDLTVNEMQAYLMFTHDHDFFDITAVGLTQARRKQLETAFRQGIPVPWVKAMPSEPLRLPGAPVASAGPAAPAAKPRPAATSAACAPGQHCR